MGIKWPQEGYIITLTQNRCSNLSSPTTKCVFYAKPPNFHSFRFSTCAHFWNTAHAAIHSSPQQCFLKMNYVLASKQNGHRVICSQCHGLSLTELSWGWKSDVGRFRRCYGACFGNCSCADILTKIFIGLLASEGSFLDLCVREETFQRKVSKVSLIIKQLLTRKIVQSSGGLRNRCKTTAQVNKVGTA